MHTAALSRTTSALLPQLIHHTLESEERDLLDRLRLLASLSLDLPIAGLILLVAFLGRNQRDIATFLVRSRFRRFNPDQSRVPNLAIYLRCRVVAFFLAS